MFRQANFGFQLRYAFMDLEFYLTTGEGDDNVCTGDVSVWQDGKHIEHLDYGSNSPIPE